MARRISIIAVMLLLCSVAAYAQDDLPQKTENYPVNFKEENEYQKDQTFHGEIITDDYGTASKWWEIALKVISDSAKYDSAYTYTRNFLTPEMFGAGDSATDNTAAIIAMLTNASSTKRGVYIPKKHYRFEPDSTTLITDIPYIVIDGVLDARGVHENSDPNLLPAGKNVFFTYTGDVQLIQHNVDVIEGNRYLPLPSNAEAGDVLYILSDEAYFPMSDTIPSKAQKIIIDYNRNDTIWLSQPIMYTLDSTSVYYRSSDYNINISGTGSILASDSANELVCFDLQASDANISGITIKNFGDKGFQISGGNFNFNDIHINNSFARFPTNGRSYGILVGGLSTLNISSSYIHGGRHGISSGGDRFWNRTYLDSTTTPQPWSLDEDINYPSYVYINDCKASSSAENGVGAVNSHTINLYTEINNSTLYGGLSLNGEKANINGCTIITADYYGINATPNFLSKDWGVYNFTNTTITAAEGYSLINFIILNTLNEINFTDCTINSSKAYASLTNGLRSTGRINKMTFNNTKVTGLKEIDVVIDEVELIDINNSHFDSTQFFLEESSFYGNFLNIRNSTFKNSEQHNVRAASFKRIQISNSEFSKPMFYGLRFRDVDHVSLSNTKVLKSGLEGYFMLNVDTIYGNNVSTQNPANGKAWYSAGGTYYQLLFSEIAGISGANTYSGTGSVSEFSNDGFTSDNIILDGTLTDGSASTGTPSQALFGGSTPEFKEVYTKPQSDSIKAFVADSISDYVYDNLSAQDVFENGSAVSIADPLILESGSSNHIKSDTTYIGKTDSDTNYIKVVGNALLFDKPIVAPNIVGATSAFTTTDATPVTRLVDVPSGESHIYEIYVSAKSGTKQKTWLFLISANNASGGGASILTPQTKLIDGAEDAAMVSATFSVDVSAGKVRLNFTGVAATTIDWEFTVTKKY